MADRFRLHVAPGRRVLDPRTGKPIPGSTDRQAEEREQKRREQAARVGEKLSESKVRRPEDFARDYPRTPYFVRRVLAGDMIEAPPAKPRPRPSTTKGE